MSTVKHLKLHVLLLIIGVALTACQATPAPDDPRGGDGDKPAPRVEGWLGWRGPTQNGVSTETDLPSSWTPGGDNDLWSYEIAGRGTAVIAGDRVYAFGYRGEGPNLREWLICLDAATGKELWTKGFNDFISDIIYSRYAIGAPTVDAETGNVYLGTSPGLVVCLTRDGKQLWERSLMEEFGRLTFPNGRTGCVVIDGDLAIVNIITSFWGKQGPARNRFYAFDKRTGELVWSSTPGTRPVDSSFSTPYFEWRGGKRVFYAGTGCGHVVAVNARTGKPLWRFRMCNGGVNISPVVYKDRLISIHGKENLDTTRSGRMIAIKLGALPAQGKPGPAVLDKSSELWRNDHLSMFTASPTIVGDRVYQINKSGVLWCIDVMTGKAHWKLKLANSQLHASPLYADGKLYIPMWNGWFFIVKPGDKAGEVLHKVKLEGACIGSASVWNGRIYVHTSKKLYCFGKREGATSTPKAAAVDAPQPGEAVRLLPIPAEILLRPGVTQRFRLRQVDANGLTVGEHAAGTDASWAKHIPATAKVKVKLDADFDAQGALVAGEKARLSAGMFKVTDGGLAGFVRGRLLPESYNIDFESFKTVVKHKKEKGVTFAYPPLPWIGARLKWEIRVREGNKVLAKTLDRVLFQRAMTFIGPASMKNYTVEADVLSDGDRRIMCSAGVVNQRYKIALVGNWQTLEVTSNHDRLKVSVPFSWDTGVWYRLKSRVDVLADGSGVIRAKAWKRGDKEPEKWTIEVKHKIANTHGAPGLYGFSPQSRYRVYLDNVVVTANK